MSKGGKIVYSIFFALISIWCLLALASPTLMALGQKEAGIGLWKILGFGCHQKADRSFYIFGWQMGLCIRCTAIYFSIWLGAILYPLIRKKHFPIWIILVLIAPISIDILTDKYLGLRMSTNAIRFITGTPCGISLPYFIISGMTAILEYINKLLIKIKKGVYYEKIA